MFESKFNEAKLKNAFSKIREEILYLHQELIILKQEIRQINQVLNQILASNTSSTHLQHKKLAPTHISRNYDLNRQYFHSSIGNEGVPTNSQQIFNRQISRQKMLLKQTKQTIPTSPVYGLPLEHQTLTKPAEQPQQFQTTQSIKIKPNIRPAIVMTNKNIANIVANMKQDLCERFKKLTRQEFLVFSILYTLEQELQHVTYRDIAQRANLAESSIRDYISRLERKGIPLVKERINNKIVILKIPRELREIATLNSLSKLVKF